MDCPADADWKMLQCEGGNSIFIVIMCLSWWGKVVTSPKDCKVFNTAVEEVASVFKNVLMSLQVLAGTKHGADDSDTAYISSKHARK
jgi:hypothetical protein